MIERTTDEIATGETKDRRVREAIKDATERATTWYLAEHYDPDLDSEHLVDAVYENLEKLGVQELARAIVLLVEPKARARADTLIAEEELGVERWLR